MESKKNIVDELDFRTYCEKYYKTNIPLQESIPQKGFMKLVSDIDMINLKKRKFNEYCKDIFTINEIENEITIDACIDRRKVLKSIDSADGKQRVEILKRFELQKTLDNCIEELIIIKKTRKLM